MLTAKEFISQTIIRNPDKNKEGMPMRAYVITEEIEGASLVVFAETRGKAAGQAMRNELFEDYEYTKIKPYRAPLFDKYYRGQPQMDWDNKDERIALVKAGWYCIGYHPEPCEDCPAKKYCIRMEKVTE